MKTGGKSNSRLTIEWKLFHLDCDAKDYKHYAFAFKIYKSLVKDSRRLRSKCYWSRWVMCCRQS